MTEQELAKLKKETCERLMNALDLNDTQANFVISLTKSYHCALGGALYAINDFLDSRGL